MILSIIMNIKNMKKANKIRKQGKEDILKLDDEEFYETIECLCYDIVYDINDQNIDHHFILIYSLFEFESEVNNGGLCQFFVNSSRLCAPYLQEALEMIGAYDIKELLNHFLLENQIDVNDLSSFQIKKREDYEKQTKRYDFDSFDQAFYENDDFHKKIIYYCRNHIDELLKG